MEKKFQISLLLFIPNTLLKIIAPPINVYGSCASPDSHESQIKKSRELFDSMRPIDDISLKIKNIYLFLFLKLVTGIY